MTRTTSAAVAVAAAPRRRRRRLPVLALLVAGLALSGCTATVAGSGTRLGGVPDFPSNGTNTPAPSASASASASGPGSSSSPGGGDAADLVAAMADAMKAVENGFRVAGDFDEGGQGSALDLQVQGSSGQGTITLDGSVCEVRAVGGVGWAKAPAAFWSDYVDTTAAVATQIAGQWVELSGDIEFLLAFVEQGTFVDTILPSDEDFTLGDPTTVAGVAAQEVVGDDETLVIATAAPNLLLSIEDDTGTAQFMFPDSAAAVTAPTPTIPYPG